MRTRRNGTGGDPWFGHAGEGLWLWPLPAVDHLRQPRAALPRASASE